ncbi:MAG: 30S ribosome-binding factor RbfA [Kiloniellales bacterium]
MTRSGGRAPSQRQLRVGEALRHALAAVLTQGGFKDPLLSDAMITVTEVRVSPDLRDATAFVTPLGGVALQETVAALNRAAGFIRSRLAPELELRFLPRLSFQADHSFEDAMRLRAVMAQPRVQQDLAENDDDADTNGSMGEGNGHGA